MERLSLLTCIILAALLSGAPAAAEAPAVAPVQAPHGYIDAHAWHILPETHNNESGYFALCVGKNGRVYIGTALYGENAYLVEFDPATQKQRIVVDTNALCGSTGTGIQAQSKIHTRLYVGPSGKIYLGSKQGYATKDEKEQGVEYPGGFVMAYDPATDTAACLGMPMAKQGVIDVTADEQRGLLYVVTCEDEHWMVGDLEGKTYTKIGPQLFDYAATLVDPQGRAHALTKDLALATYDPATQNVTLRDILIDGKPLRPFEEGHSIPTWQLSPDGRSAYMIMLSRPDLYEIRLDAEPGATKTQGKNLGRFLDTERSDSRSSLTVAPDGRVYVQIIDRKSTEFSKRALDHIARYDPATGTFEDLGVVSITNPDYFDFSPLPDGKRKPWSHGVITLPDGKLTPLYHQGLVTADNNTLYALVLAPFALLRMEVAD